MAWANTGAAPSVEIPITSGERLTMAPNEKSQNAGLSITFTENSDSASGSGEVRGVVFPLESTDRDCCAGKITSAPCAAGDGHRTARRIVDDRQQLIARARRNRHRPAHRRRKAVQLSTLRRHCCRRTTTRFPARAKNSGSRASAIDAGGLFVSGWRKGSVHAARPLPVLAWKSRPLPVRATKARADREFAKAFVGLAFFRIGREHRIEGGDDTGVIEVFGVQLRQPRAVECRAEIEVVAAGAFADEADFREIGPRAAVRAAGHADDDVVGGEAVGGEPFVERSISSGR
jgi:hypothetical protein